MPGDPTMIQLMANNKLSIEKEAASLMQVMFPKDKIKRMLPKMRALFAAADFSGRVSSTAIQLENELAQKWYEGHGTYHRLGEIDCHHLSYSWGPRQDRRSTEFCFISQWYPWRELHRSSRRRPWYYL